MQSYKGSTSQTLMSLIGCAICINVTSGCGCHLKTLLGGCGWTLDSNIAKIGFFTISVS